MESFEQNMELIYRINEYNQIFDLASSENLDYSNTYLDRCLNLLNKIATDIGSIKNTLQQLISNIDNGGGASTAVTGVSVIGSIATTLSINTQNIKAILGAFFMVGVIISKFLKQALLEALVFFALKGPIILSTITSIISGVATAITGLLAAAAPIVLIIIAIIAIIALIYGVVAAINHFAGTTISATGVIMGAYGAVFALLHNYFVYFWNFIANIVNTIVNGFTHPIMAFKVFLYNLLLNWLSFFSKIMNAVGKMVNKIPGVSIDVNSGIDDAINNIEDKIKEQKDLFGYNEVIKTLDYTDYDKAFEKGYSLGEKTDEKVGALVSGNKGSFSVQEDVINQANMQSQNSYTNMQYDMVSNNSYRSQENMMHSLPAEFTYTNQTSQYMANAQNSDDITSASAEDIRTMREIMETKVVDVKITNEVVFEPGSIVNEIKEEADIHKIINAFTKRFEYAVASTCDGVIKNIGISGVTYSNA